MHSYRRISPTLLAAVAALGGFLFGFDSAVINGTVAALESSFHSTTVATGFSVSSMLLGSAIGAFYAGQLSDRIGRKKTMVCTALIFAVSALGSGLAPSALLFVLFRILGGVAVGAASVIAPAYIAEVSPARVRGRLGSLQQLAIVFGIFVAFFSNYLFGLASGSADAPFWLGLKTWRYMLAIQIFPALAYAVGALLIPESPRFLVARGMYDHAQRVLQQLGEPSPPDKVAEIKRTTLQSTKPSLRDLRQGQHLRPIVWVGIGLAVFQQLVGINVVFYYGAILWQSAGFTEKQSLLINVISGLVNITTTLCGLAIIDRFGRKPVLIVGSLGMVVTLSMIAVSFGSSAYTPSGELHLTSQMAVVALVSANLYIFFFGFSWGPIVWVMLGEMFNNRIRGSAISVCTAFNWLANFVITTTFPIMLRGVGLSFAYACYASAAALSLYFVHRKVRETKGVELEAMA